MLLRSLLFILFLPVIVLGQVKIDHTRGVIKLPTGSGPSANGEIGFDGTNLKIFQGGSSGNVSTGGGSAAIGSLAYGATAPDSTYKATNGQVLSQASYASAYSKIGLIPDFTGGLKTTYLAPANLIDVAYSPELDIYVAITNETTVNSILWSTDCLNWHSIDIALNTNTPAVSIDYCSGLHMFVFTNGSGIVWTSTDGKRWRYIMVPADGGLSTVTCSSTTTVVANTTPVTDNSVESVWTTTDGATWTRRSIASSSKTITSLYWSTGLSLFFLGCSDGTINTSPDGITWTARTSNIASQINHFASSGSLVVAVGNAGVISSSPDGVTWTARTTQTANALSGVAYLSGATNPWVAQGVSSLMTSTNGTTWVTQNNASLSRSQITYSPSAGLYLMVGGGGLMATSPDLRTWTGHTAAEPTIQMNATVAPTTTFVCVGNSGKIDSSTDSGSTWSARTSNTAQTLNCVTYIAGSTNLYIAAGAGAAVVTSPDGTTWTSRTSNFPGGSSILGIASKTTGGDVIVIVGTNGGLCSSTNGTSWTARTSGSSTTLNAIAWNGTVFCAVGGSTNFGEVVTSPDGVTWTKQPVSGISGVNTLLGITSDGTYFYAFATLSTTGNPIYKSIDGVSWTPVVPVLPVYGLAYLNSNLIVYDSVGSIAYSTDQGSTWSNVNNSRYASANAKKIRVFNSRFILSQLGGPRFSSDGVLFEGMSASSMSWGGVTFNTSTSTVIGVSNAGGIFLSDTQGTTWSRISGYQTEGGVSFTGVAYSPTLDMSVICASTGFLLRSTNNTTWTQCVYTPSTEARGGTSGSNLSGQLPENIAGIEWIDGLNLFVVYGTPGLIVTSSDGVTWTRRSIGTDGIVASVAYNSSLGLLVAAGTGFIVTSPDAVTWTIEQNYATSILPSSIASLGTNGFVAIGASGVRLYSADGHTWRAQVGMFGNVTTSGPLVELSDLGGCLINPTGGNPGANIVYSTDGFTWATTPLDIGIFAITDMVYNSSLDLFTCLGNATPSGLATLKLTRRYNKTTEFELPMIPNTWIKVQ